MSVGDLIWGLIVCTGVLAGAMVAAGHAVQVAEQKRRERVRSRVSMVRRNALDGHSTPILTFSHVEQWGKRQKVPPLRMVGKR
jgi:hypothetical protein